MLTKEQYEILKPYEDKLKTALYSDYARNVTQDGFNKLNMVYKEVFGTESKLGTGCGRCQLKELKRLAKEYFDYPKQLKAQNLEKARQAKELKKLEKEMLETNGVIENKQNKINEQNEES